MMDVSIVDTTLRDGEQTAGIAFSLQEKVHIAKLLDGLGVKVIEAGIPAMGHIEQEAIRAILKADLKAQITTWNRINIKDIKASLQCGAKYLHLSAPVSDLHIFHKLGKNHSWVTKNLCQAIRYAKDQGCQVSAGAEDASRADINYLLEFAQAAQEEGVTRLRLADTVGILEPFSAYQLTQTLVNKTGLDIEIHTHNDFGMATANSLAALKGGAKWVSTTINGIGERAGNTSLEELVLALKGLYGLDLGISSYQLLKLSKDVAAASRRIIPEGIIKGLTILEMVG